MSSLNESSGVYVTQRGTRVPFSVRRSSRATRAKVRVTSRGEFEVVLPTRSLMRPLQILGMCDAWVEQTYRKTAGVRSTAQVTNGIPNRIEFPVSNEVWDVDLHRTNAKGVSTRVDVERGVVRISGNVDDDEAVRRALRRFVKLRAQDVLVHLLELVSQDAGIPYASARISTARSRWGSCSRNGDIMLSWRLMFLPQPLAIHVCLHELCHTRCFDHSARFHRLLESLDADAKKHVTALKAAETLIPSWMYD